MIINGVAQVIQVIKAIQLIQVMQVKLAHLWPDFWVIYSFPYATYMESNAGPYHSTNFQIIETFAADRSWEATKTIGIFKAHLGLQMSLHIICFIPFLYVFSAKNGYQKKN